MGEFVIRRTFQSPLTMGIAGTILCVCAALVFWPVWALLCKEIITLLSGPGIVLAGPKLGAKLVSNFAEGTFFFMIINAWIWQILLFGGYGKTWLTERQPYAGIWYTCVGLMFGALAFLVIAGFLGAWWKPFSLATLLAPRDAAEVRLAVEGWELVNFYTLPVLIVQIPFASLFHKWPFAGNSRAPVDGFGVMMTSSFVALLVWVGTVIPSLAKLRLGEEDILMQPFGSWPAYLAFCQAFIWWFLIPAEGGEHYPMKLFAKKQPYMGLIGLVIALTGGFLTPALLRPIVTAVGLAPTVPVDIVVSSLEISVILFTLLWHHVFDDYPSSQMVPNQMARVASRIVIWLVGGAAWGVFWLEFFRVIPFGAYDLGLGYPGAGLVAGQFVLIMMAVIFNTYFDKWPLVRKTRAKTPILSPAPASAR